MGSLHYRMHWRNCTSHHTSGRNRTTKADWGKEKAWGRFNQVCSGCSWQFNSLFSKQWYYSCSKNIWSSCSYTDCAAYGESDLLLLTSQYASFLDHNLCSLEWDTLKHCMKIITDQVTHHYWHTYNTRKQSDSLWYIHTITLGTTVLLLDPPPS